jgi:hypothetical protein
MILPETIFALRRKSGASLTACRSALEACAGDPERALLLLQELADLELQDLEEISGLDEVECRDLLLQWGSPSAALAYLDSLCEEEEQPTSPAAQHLPWEEIWAIKAADEFTRALGQYLAVKKFSRREPLSQAETSFLLLARLMPVIESAGLADLFYQEYSLDDCRLVEVGLVQAGLPRLAELFAEARSIYTLHNPLITQAAYEMLEPFDIPRKEQPRFDQIGGILSAEGSEITQKLAAYARQRRGEFSP